MTPALREEAAVLHALLAACSDAELETRTPHRDWRVVDTLVHLTFVDWMARLALTEPDRYRAELAAMNAAVQGTGDGPVDADATYRRMSRHQHTRVSYARPRELPERWVDGFEHLASLFDQREPAERIDWFGRPMQLQRLVAARQMEIWAYGQDVFDACRAVRSESDRIHAVADFCVRTFGLGFALRGLQVPATPPAVRLTSPSGLQWRWHDPDDLHDRGQVTQWVSGPAVDFCLVVTQRRHRLDTALSVHGPLAEQWMTIAQSIAGPPSDAPPAGVRRWRAR